MELPFIDEHRVLVAAPPAAVWRALGQQFKGNRVTKAVAPVVGAEPRRAAGAALEAGSTVAGFTVAEVEPERLLRLAGRHRYSNYELTFVLTDEPGGTMLAARTHAAFPGPLGFVYRSLVIGTGGHRLVVRRMLAGIKRASRP
ncbi:SRPBCC family protein [Kutzneria chonburiensis]|uniref:SRPBCC family protein n=1 Tax=Kutzneria chonburiensis TaxID=1483604 RepID=A0ABV6N8L2_9PSEU|nr:SRPBCC family protein [Kutzneria chonburiensis]